MTQYMDKPSSSTAKYETDFTLGFKSMSMQYIAVNMKKP